MFLDSRHGPRPLLLAATLGIALGGGRGGGGQLPVEHGIDAVMQRTRWRPLARGELSAAQTLVFAGLLGGAGLAALPFRQCPHDVVTAATFVATPCVHGILKPATPHRNS